MSKPKAPRRSLAEWQQIFSDYRASGLSLRAYGHQHNLNYHTLVHWKKKLSRRLDKMRRNSEKKSEKKFIALHNPSLLNSFADKSVKQSIKIHYDYNIDLELPDSYPVTDLVALLKGLSC